MRNPLDLTGRNILVTGASSGLGRSVCVLLSQLGASVVLVARNADRLQVTRSQMEGTRHFLKPFDVSQVETIPEWMRGLAGEAGRLSGVVHCAGVRFIHPLRVLQPDKWDELMRVNVSAAVALTKGLRHNLVRAERSSVVYLSSVMAFVGQQGLAAYSASKGALVSLAKSLALELASEGVRVNCVAPGNIRTEMTEQAAEELQSAEQVKAIDAMHPLGPGEPLDVANAVAFLMSDMSRWITGQTLVVDGGYTIH